MSTTTVCPASVVSSAGWSLTGAASFNAALSDGSDASYASYPVTTTISSSFGSVFDTSAIPQSAIIHSVVLSVRVGISVDSAEDAGSFIYFLSDDAGFVYNSSLPFAWAGSSAFVNTTLDSPVLTTDPAGPLSREDITAMSFAAVAQTSAGNATLRIYALSLSVLWSARTGVM